MAVSSTQQFPIPTHVQEIRAIYVLSISNQIAVCIAFKKGCEAVRQAAEKVLCPDYWEHNTLIGHMPADNRYIQERRCVCKLLSTDASPLIQKILDVVDLVGTKDSSHLRMVPVIPTINLLDTIQAPPAQALVDIKEVHGS